MTLQSVSLVLQIPQLSGVPILMKQKPVGSFLFNKYEFKELFCWLPLNEYRLKARSSLQFKVHKTNHVALCFMP